VRPFPESWAVKIPQSVPDADEVRVNLAEKTIRVYDKTGQQLCLFHCSVAKDKEKLPARDAKIEAIVPNPNYTFNPKYWPEVHNVDRVLIIPPGPRNPVGVMWIQLDLPGYGMHGNPKPELIGKTGSHGCFRLTNWDAVRYASFVRVGMTVKMVNPER
jgi:lipoprotein-anchoring transpeptidase ErfK/SrfK